MDWGYINQLQNFQLVSENLFEKIENFFLLFMLGEFMVFYGLLNTHCVDRKIPVEKFLKEAKKGFRAVI